MEKAYRYRFYSNAEQEELCRPTNPRAQETLAVLRSSINVGCNYTVVLTGRLFHGKSLAGMPHPTIDEFCFDS
jgi:hypothetical protein